MQVWKLLDDFITREQVRFPGQVAFWPSEASVAIPTDYGHKIEGACMREVFYRRKFSQPAPATALQDYLEDIAASGKEPYRPYMAWIHLIGKATERMVTEEAKKMGLWAGNNLKFYDPEHNISGEIDLLLWDIEADNNTRILNEIKSIYGYYATKQIIGTQSHPGFPRWSNLLQIALYLDYLRFVYPYGKLLYICRDSIDRVEYDIAIENKEGGEEERIITVNGFGVHQFKMKDIYDRFRVIQEYIDKDIVPPNDFVPEYSPEMIEILHEAGEISKAAYTKYKKKGEPIGHWKCQTYCPWASRCWGNS